MAAHRPGSFPHSFPPPSFHCSSVWQVPVSLSCVGAPGWVARICQPWEKSPSRNWLPIVEVPGCFRYPYLRIAMQLLTVDTCTMLNHHNSENFTVSGCIKWLGEPVKPEHATKMVREAEITDPTGAINLLIWDSHIQQIKGENSTLSPTASSSSIMETPCHHSIHNSYRSTRAGHLPCWAIKLGVLSRHHEGLSSV